jgi:isoquinoline 1-oxidoreductase alpha subunit
MTKISINQISHELNAPLDTPLLWFIRDYVGLTGTKYGCGEGHCGACTVMIDGVAKRSCLIQLDELEEGQKVDTIESLEIKGKLSKVQQAWFDHDVPQCGYCQSGMIMAVTALLRKNPKPSDQQIDSTIKNICRCGTFQEVKAAIHQSIKS